MIKYAALALVFFLAFGLNALAQERMGPIPPGQMTDAQKKAAADHAAARGSLTGPWNVLLRSPDLMGRVRGLSDYVRFNGPLPPRLSEFVILVTARQWSQPYEWNAHYPLALKGGLNPEIAKAIADGRRPHGMAEDEEILYDFCTELLQNRSVSDATYARAVAKFGERGLLDTIGLMGHYSLIAMVLNTARTPVPPGGPPPLARFPQ
ncbi:MAG: carboxymuconolactone decarboxylase family protein [Acidobacteria bacterium]|nr:carboxymuconolactone decarboxylase family protein [Acidobacteriota bacterium]